MMTRSALRDRFLSSFDRLRSLDLRPARLLLGGLVGALLLLATPAWARTVLVGPHGDPLKSLPAAAGKRYVVGVMGGAGAHVPPQLASDIRTMGKEIALLGHVTLTGGCPGLPHEAVRGAKAAGGLTIGISGHSSKKSHVAHNAPLDGFDVLQFTSLPPALRGQQRPNYMGREIDNIERSNAIILVGGRSGTLGEFAIAYEEGRPIGVLKGSGGISDEVSRLVKVMIKEGKSPRAPIIYDSNPKKLVRRLIDATENKKDVAFKWEG